MGDKPYPAAPTGLDLRQNREQLPERYQKSQAPGIVPAGSK